jgi:beta-alanine--pyruvate transaminase
MPADALIQGPENTIELFHGYIYSHPLACAAGLAALDVYQDLRPLLRGWHPDPW